MIKRHTTHTKLWLAVALVWGVVISTAVGAFFLANRMNKPTGILTQPEEEEAQQQSGRMPSLNPNQVVDRRSGDVVDIASPVATIAEESAAEYDRQVVSVEGVVEYNFDSGKQTILAFHPHHKGYFKVLIKEQYYPDFPDKIDIMYLKADRIRVTGLLEWYQGDPTIFVTHPSQIVRLNN